MLNTTHLVEGKPFARAIRADLVKGLILDRPLGSGATSTVYLAVQDAAPHGRFAVKILQQSLFIQTESRKRWEREADLLISLNHPNIVRGFKHGMTDGLPWLVMEYVQGETLMDRLRRMGKLSAAELFNIAESVLKGLAAAHLKDIIHRDVKPANIVSTAEGTVKLMDFGLAKVTSDVALTSTGFILGTPIYLSPEQAVGEEHLTIRSDLYALGVTLFHLATGRTPFSELNCSLLLTRKITDDVPDVREVDDEIDPWLATFIAMLCARRVGERPAHPEAALELLEQMRTQTFDLSLHRGSTRTTGARLRPAKFEEIPQDNQVLHTLVGDSQLSTSPCYLASGEVLFYEDDAAADCFVLLSGKVEILRAGRVIGAVSEPGSFIGEMGPLRGKPRSATVVAREECVLLVIAPADFNGFFLRHPEMAMTLARTLAERLDTQNQKLQEAEERLAGVGVHVREMSSLL